MRAIRLQTEYLTRPLGLGITKPRFYWNCEGGAVQTAYQIIARRSGEKVWDSGKVASASMTHICYGGKPLQSRDRIDWQVRLWDENDHPGEWSGSWFEMGLLKKEDWSAKWMTGDYRPRKNVRYPVDYFQKTFPVKGTVARARLYITACGLYKTRLNGRRVGKYCLTPGCTDYRKRLQYQTYDVTDFLAAHNTLEIRLADGWYRGSVGCYGMTNVFGRESKIFCQMEIIYADGSRNTIISDDGWSWSNDGPCRFADLKDGEIYDAGRKPSYRGSARLTKAPEDMILAAADNVCPTEQEHFPAKLIITPAGKKVLDFGQNLAGFLSFTVHGEKGQQIKLRLGEMLDEKGEFTQKNIQSVKPVREVGKLGEVFLAVGMGGKLPGEKQMTPKQEILFTCSGGIDHYKTAFAVAGFRYALIETEIEVDPQAFEAIAVYSDMEQTGSFRCSNGKVNQLFHNTLWSMKGNFLDVPTDCPTRERLGWTGDAQIFFETGAYLMNTAPFFRKWLRDVKDGQKKDGSLSAVVPYNGLSLMYDNTGASVGWADAVVLVPYRYWKRYGDRRILRENYQTMRKLAMFMIQNTGHKNKKAARANPYNKYVYEKGFHLGEWLEPEEFQEKITAGHRALHTEEATAYLHYTMSCMAEIARELQQQEDEKLFAEYADGAVKAYDYLFLKSATIDTDRQAKLVRPLALGLLSGAKKSNVEKRLKQAVERGAYCVGTGFLSTPFILPVLTGAGYTETAYKMLENEQAPGWLAEINAGATTIWEEWEGRVSRNHYSPGAVCQWLFETVAGIRPDGENHFKIAPVPGGTLTYAEAGYQSIYGKIESRWTRTEDGVRYTITVPANTTAEVIFPDGDRCVIAAGCHEFERKQPGGMRMSSFL